MIHFASRPLRPVVFSRAGSSQMPPGSTLRLHLPVTVHPQVTLTSRTRRGALPTFFSLNVWETTVPAHTSPKSYTRSSTLI